MGRKAKPQKNHEKDHLLARSIRKRAQHTTKQNIRPRNEAQMETGKGAAQALDVKEWKAKKKEKKTNQQEVTKKVRWTTPVKDDVAIQVVKEQEIPLEELQVNQSNVSPKSERTETPGPMMMEKTFESQPVAPTAPIWDMKKAKEICEDRKRLCLDYLSTYNSVFKRRSIYNEDLTLLKSLPRYNGISREIEKIVKEVKMNNKQLKEELEEDRKEIQEEFREIFNEEFSLYTDLKKYSTALEELRIVLAILNLDKYEVSYNVDKTIPTRDDFKEVTKILRDFIAIRNERLERCFTTEFRKNKAADNYADMFRKYRKNKSLLECTLFQRSNENTGYRVLSISNKILLKMVEQLRTQMKVISSKKENTTWRVWKRKISNYDLHVNKHRRDINQMTNCLTRKSTEIENRSDEAKKLLEKLREVKKDLHDQNIIFEEKIMKTTRFEEERHVGGDLEKVVDELKGRLPKDVDALKILQEKFEDCKLAERNASHAHLFKEAEKMKCEYVSRNQKSKQLEMIQIRLKEDLRMKNGIILQYEEMQEEFHSEMARCKRMLIELHNEKETTLYNNRKLRQKLRQMKRQLSFSQKHEFDDKSFTQCIISK